MTEIRWWCCDAPYGEHEPNCKNAALPPVRSEPLLADDSQFLCTVCGQVGSVGRCCGLDTREPLNDLARAELAAEEKRKANVKGERHERSEAE